MSARHKLNGAHVLGAVAIAGLIGGIAGSWTAFLLASSLLIAIAVYDGGIRLR